MPIIIDEIVCTGCRECVEVCPGDLLAINPENGKAFQHSPDDCWHCMACVKVCPANAIELILPYVVALRGARLSVSYGEEEIEWGLHFPSGEVKRLRRRIKISGIHPEGVEGGE
ncbi:MAG: 4Fe-4S binding protein [Armatimonadota bacterium]|nr:4Fe-4S binding protein [Armatimonadota bacterium]MDW8026549.1 4Fe-4S binding protein [Armatimonadota bacterium]